MNHVATSNKFDLSVDVDTIGDKMEELSSMHIVCVISGEVSRYLLFKRQVKCVTRILQVNEDKIGIYSSRNESRSCGRKKSKLTIWKSSASSIFFMGVAQIQLVTQSVDQLELIELSDVTKSVSHACEWMFPAMYSTHNAPAEVLSGKIPISPDWSYCPDIGRNVEQCVNG
jgi:hypothetical protein